MLKSFPEYNSLSPEVLKNLWNSALFIFDTNVLLNLYRYSDETSNKFLETIIGLKPRIWVPFQVGIEYHRNRLGVISEQKKLYEDFEKKFNEILSDIDNKHRNPFLSKEITDNLNEIKGRIKVEVDEKKAEYDLRLNKDTLLDKINLVFEDKVGPSYSEEEVKKIQIQGEKRYKDKIPPGFQDIKKPENKRYGDLIMWKQIIAKSKQDAIDIIFVLDDKKEDWWLEHQGKTISARPELLSEFQNETNRLCHFYQPFQFLEYSNHFLGNTIEPTVIDEVKNYEHDVSNSTNKPLEIQIVILLESSSDDLEKFIQRLQITGYDIVHNTINKNDHLHRVIITLPNIPDLIRRLKNKYLTDGYGLTFLSVIPHVPEDFPSV
jgi:gas vesicle protein